MNDYSKVVLGDYEQELFDLFRNSDEIQMTLKDFKVLRAKNLVKGAFNGKSDWFDLQEQNGTVQISGFGKGLRAYQKRQRQQEEKEEKRYKTSTRLSIAAIIISILALGLQLADMIFQIAVGE